MRATFDAHRLGSKLTIRTEWIRFRTGRGWVIGMVAVGALIMLPGLLIAAGSHAACMRGTAVVSCAPPPAGPGGEAVQDGFFFLNRQLDGDGSVTVRVGPMTGRFKQLPSAATAGKDPGVSPGVEPWAKAGIMIKKSLRQGASYTAVMTTSEHGVRMQHDFTQDTAGEASDRWLKLARAGRTVTGYESPDGNRWTRIGTTELDGPARIGLFAASPTHPTVDRTPGSAGVSASFAEVTATVDHLALQGTSGEWSRDNIGLEYELDGAPHHPGGAVLSGGTWTLTGVGDVAPLVDGPRVEGTLTGLIPGLVMVIVVAVLFTTGVYRRGHRPTGLMAKAAVIAGTASVTGLIAGTVAVFAGARLLEANGLYVLPVSVFTAVRVVVGAAAICAAVAVLAVAIGALFRRRLVAVAAAVAVIVLPYVLATTLVLPDSLARWVLRLTPAAGAAVLQSIPEYPQVLGSFVPAAGFYPLPPWAGLAVLCGYSALALALANRRTRRRDV